MISGGEDSKVKVWETENAKCIQTIQHDNFVQDFLVEGNELISVSYDGRILTNIIKNNM